MRLDPINLYDYEERAKLVLPHDDWDTIDAGAMDMFTTRRNRTAFEELTLRPRFLRDIGERDLSTTMLGNELSMPVFVCPAAPTTGPIPRERWPPLAAPACPTP